MNEKLLEEVGLTKGEIKVYLALLKIGETTTGRIIEKAQISSGKIYEILDKLIKKGLVSYMLKDKTKHFSAASPNRILDYVHVKEKELKQKEEMLSKELPSLLEVEKEIKKEYETQLFIGFKGFETAIFDSLEKVTSQDEILAMGVTGEKSEKFNFLWQKWHKKRIKKKIECKILFTEKETKYYNLFKKMKYTEVKYIEGIAPAAADIIGEKVLLLTHGKEPSCLSIKHSEIKQSFTTFFYNLWKKAKSE